MKNKNNKFTIVIDTREQLPYKYKGSVKKALKSGDYSILGLENVIAIERKTKEDAYGSCGARRVRFEKEMVRLSRLDYSAVVIETTLEDLLIQPSFTKMNPLVVINSFVSWSVKFGVHIFFASDREYGSRLVKCILEKYWKHKACS